MFKHRPNAAFTIAFRLPIVIAHPPSCRRADMLLAMVPLAPPTRRTTLADFLTGTDFCETPYFRDRGFICRAFWLCIWMVTHRVPHKTTGMEHATQVTRFRTKINPGGSQGHPAGEFSEQVLYRTM